MKIIVSLLLSLGLLYAIYVFLYSKSIDESKKNSIEVSKQHFFEEEISSKINGIDFILGSSCFGEIRFKKIYNFKADIDFCKQELLKEFLTLGDSVNKPKNSFAITIYQKNIVIAKNIKIDF